MDIGTLKIRDVMFEVKNTIENLTLSQHIN